MTITILSSYLVFSICYRICESKFILSKSEIISILNQIISYPSCGIRQDCIQTDQIMNKWTDSLTDRQNLPSREPANSYCSNRPN